MHKNYFVDSLTEIGNSEYLTKIIKIILLNILSLNSL